MPGFPMPASGGAPERAPGGSAMPSMPGKAAYGGQRGGQVMISGPEEKALRVLELDNPDDPNDDMQILQRASQESGMPIDRVQKLKARAEAARNKGMTLKGPTITLQPINPQVEDGLLGSDWMADVGGAATAPGSGAPPGSAATPSLGASPAAGQGMQSPAGSMGPAAGAPRVPPSAATMSSAGLGSQRYAPAWRPQMSQATAAPPRMTPDTNTAPAAPPKPHTPVPGTQTPLPQRGAGLPRQPAQRPMSQGSAGFGRADARDPRLAAAYAREARTDVEECNDCNGRCRKKARR